jgi:hypothetical protein
MPTKVTRSLIYTEAADAGKVLTSNGSTLVWTASSSLLGGGGAVTAINTAKAWVNFNGTTGTIRSSYNVSSVTYNGIGEYTVNFATPMANANYTVIGGGQHWRSSSTTYGNITTNIQFDTTPTVNSVQIVTTSYNEQPKSTAIVTVAIFGN